MTDSDKVLYWKAMSRGDMYSAKGNHAQAMYWYAKAYNIKNN